MATRAFAGARQPPGHRGQDRRRPAAGARVAFGDAMSVRVFAPAKINLTLKVGRPRADGLHPIESVVAFADVGDTINAEESDTLSLSIEGDFADQLAADDGNLALRAAQALAAAAGVPAGARL